MTLGTLPGGVFGAGSSEVTPDVLNPCPREEGPGGGSAVSLGQHSVPEALQCPQGSAVSPGLRSVPR